MKHPSLSFIPICVFIWLAVFPAYAQGQIIQRKDNVKGVPALLLQQPIHDAKIQNRVFEQVSSIAATSDGQQIYIAWYSGGKGEGPGNYITLSVSLDFGKTWKNDQLVVYPKDTADRFFDPALWRDNNGQIWLFYAASTHHKSWDLKGGVNAIAISWEGSHLRYQEPILLSYGIMINNPVYVSQKHVALFPVSVWQLGKDHSREPGYIQDGTFIFKYDYKNKAKGLGVLSPYSSISVLPDSMRTFDEHQIVQTSDKGDFLCLVRTRKGIYYTKSADFGKHWSGLEPFTSTGPTTSSRFHIGRLQSGNLILVLNNSTTRNNMTAFLSRDGGKTWPYKLLLEGRDQVSYPDVSQTKDGTIHVTYDRDRFGAKEIWYCRFKEEDILSGNTEHIFSVNLNERP